MPDNNIVDRFNVGGEEFHIEPVMDNVPIQGSLHGVTSGGVWAALQEADISHNKIFLADVFAEKLFGCTIDVEGIPSTASLRGFAKLDDVVFAAGSSDMYVSLNGYTWNSTSTGYMIDKPIYFKGAYYTLCSNGIWKSNDLSSWTRVYNSTFTERKARMRVFGNRIVVVTATGGVSSETGTTWDNCSGLPSVSSALVVALEVTSTTCIAIFPTANGIYYSTDGASFSQATFSTTTTIYLDSAYDVWHIQETERWYVKCYAGNKYNVVYTDNNGVDWSAADVSNLPSGSYTFGAISCFKNYRGNTTLYLGVLRSVTSNGIIYSTDGIHWSTTSTTYKSTSGQPALNFTRFGDFIVVCGEDGVYANINLSSTTTFVKTSDLASNARLSIAFGRIICIGASGTITGGSSPRNMVVLSTATSMVGAVLLSYDWLQQLVTFDSAVLLNTFGGMATFSSIDILRERGVL